METIRCRSVFISDIHLGAAGSQVAAVQDFLYHVECENLYLVGDIIDGWVTRSKRWNQEHTNVIRTVLGKAKRGTQVFYTPGNHDAFLRRMNGSEMGFIEIDHSFVHTMVDGRELQVVHGDLFDPSCNKHSWLAYLGAWGYEYLRIFNDKLNKRRAKKQRKSMDFASKVKSLTKRMFASREKFDAVVIESARMEGFDGVVCGHVHRPEIREEDGFLYINCGDWVEHRTAILEDFDGTLRLVHWEAPAAEAVPPRKARIRLPKVKAGG